MAGQSQAANFGGMLSQIGQSIGGMGSAGDGLLQPLRNTFAPTINPNDPESLRRAADYQTRVGHTDQAALLTKQYQLAEAKAEEARKLAQGQAVARAMQQYTQAVASGDQDAIDAAEANAFEVGVTQGKDLTPALAAVEQRTRNAVNQKMAEQEQARLEKERAKVEAEKQAQQQVADAANQAKTQEELDLILKNAPKEVAVQAGEIVSRAEQRIARSVERQQKEAELNTPLDVPPAPPKDFPEGLKKQGTALDVEYKAYMKAVEDYNKKMADPQKTVTVTDRRQLQQRREQYERRLYNLTDRIAIEDYSTQKQRENTYQSRRAMILSKSISKAEVEEWQNDNATGGIFGFGQDKPSYSESVAAIRQQMLTELDNEYGKVPEASEDGADKGEIVTVSSREEIDALPVGTRFTFNGRTGTKT